MENRANGGNSGNTALKALFYGGFSVTSGVGTRWEQVRTLKEMITISLYLKTIDDSLLRTAIDEVYNVWFNYWKKIDSKDITQSLVNKCINERGTIYSKYQDYPVVHALLKALGDELEARWFGGYKTEKLTEDFNEGFEKELC